MYPQSLPASSLAVGMSFSLRSEESEKSFGGLRRIACAARGSEVVPLVAAVRIDVIDLGRDDDGCIILGDCAIGSLRINLSPRLLSTYGTAGDEFMPVIDRPDVSMLLYVLCHEWGHGRDTRKLSMARWERGRCRHPIIGADGRETYAEAFTEWHLSRGKTADAATRWYAARNQWRIQW